jgi:hypothetical protein
VTIFPFSDAAEFALLSLAKLMVCKQDSLLSFLRIDLLVILVQVLDRIVSFIMRSLPAESQQRLKFAQKLVIIVVVSGNAIGLAAHLSAGYYMSNVVALHYKMADVVELNLLSELGPLGINSAANYDKAAIGMAIQVCCEVAVLVTIIAAFCAVLPTCIKVLNNASKSAINLGIRASASKNQRESVAVSAILEEVESESRSLKRRLIFTVFAVFITFLLRVSFAVINAIGEIFFRAFRPSICC